MLTRRDMLLTTAALVVAPRLANAADGRLDGVKTLNDDFPFTVPASKELWAARKQRLREQVLVANGLWPMPVKTPLNAVVHGRIEREGYTIEKVCFASMPGHYVTGNLYRPALSPPLAKGGPGGVAVDPRTPPAAHAEGGEKEKKPGILFAHGHWENGRFHEETEKSARSLVDSKAESSPAMAKHFMQAVPATLAKLGFVVFQYDMVGYADSTAIPHIAKSGVPHPNGFADVEGELRLQSLMGLQTWNSIRALDLLASLPDVDATKLGMTGASGGGTQTFILGAIDDRLAAIVPAVMVSTGMQGGCVCENCSLLRVGTGNVELAALFAPKPLAMTAANDWTKEMPTKGYPELQKLYALLGQPDHVKLKAWPEYPHNYNKPAREFMLEWFCTHLLGKPGPVTESAFEPIPVAALSVFDKEHPRPTDMLGASELRKRMTVTSDAQLANLKPEDRATVLRAALRAMIGDELPSSVKVRNGPIESKHDGYTMHAATFGRADETDAIPCLGVFGPKMTGRSVIWIHPMGKASLRDGDKLVPVVQTLVDAGYAVVAPDVFGVGDLALPKPMAVNAVYAGFTYGYNRTLLAQRVHDILTIIAFARSFPKAPPVKLVGWGETGPWVALAKVAAGSAVDKAAVDLNGFDIAKVTKLDDPMMLPGLLKYGGLPAVLEVGDPREWLVHNDAKKLTKQTDEAVVKWLAGG